MPKSFTGPAAVLATGLVIVSCAFGQEIHLKTRAIQTPAQTTATTKLSGSDMGKICDVRPTGTETAVLQPTGSAAAGPISILIASQDSAVVNVTGSTISVSGTATGGAGITRVTWQTSNGAKGVATGISCWVASGIPVLQGTTTIILRAYDSKGASNWVAFVTARP